MRTMYYLMLYLLMVSGYSYAQEACQQNFALSGSEQVPITGNGTNSSIGAIDVDVDAASIFTIEEIKVIVTTDGFPFDFDFKLNVYEGVLGNLAGNSGLAITGMESTTPGTFTITFNLNQPFTLQGGASGKKYWIGFSALQLSTSEIQWNAGAYTPSTNQPLFYSPDGGATWTQNVPGVSGLVEGVIKVTGTCEEVEILECSQEVVSNNFESGASINAQWSQAVDVLVEPQQDFLMEQITLNVFTLPELEISGIDVYFYRDNNGLPGDLMGSQLGVSLTNDVVIGTFPSNPTDFEVRQITLDFDPVFFPGQLGEETHYWVRLHASENGPGEHVIWESTSISTLGHKIAYWNNDELQGITQSSEGVYEISGQCLPYDVTTACDTDLYDTGGTSGNYADNENEIWHIIPETGSMASVEFTSFTTEEGFDGLMVYDGPDTTYPIISSGFTLGNSTCPNGAWTGSGSYSATGTTFISTHSSGILTFVFTSNESNTEAGWEANVTCVPPGSAGNCLPGSLMTTFASNSEGGRGHMFNVTSTTDKDLTIEKFGLHVSNGRVLVNVYYIPGGYEEHDNNGEDWTFLGSQEMTGKGVGNITELKLGGIRIPAGETYGIYITLSEQITGVVKFRTKYDNHATYSDDKLVITPGLLKMNPDFGNTLSENTVWQGVIYYCEGGEEQEYEQPCLTAEYGQYPAYVYQPGCYGYPESITNQGWRGEYSKVQVTTGTQYTFSSSSVTDIITISDELGVVSIVSGTGSLTWTADFDGIVRFYTHNDESCGHYNSSVITRFVQCGVVHEPQEPNFDCFFGDGLAGSLPPQAGSSIEYEGFYGAADDFIVANQTFTVKQIRLNVFSDAPITEGRFNLYPHYNDGEIEGPGFEPFLTTPFIVPTQQIAIANMGENRKAYELTFDLPEDIELMEGHYWLRPEMKGENTFWEVSQSGVTGQFVHSGEGSWIPFEGMQAVFFISGECDDLVTSDMIGSDFTYYPNPVKDILNIKSEKAVRNVSAYNLTGTRVFTKNNLIEKQLNISFLSKGVYIFRVTLEGEQIETFKIIKE